MIVHLDTCGCVLAIGDDGEPHAFVGDPCERHTGAAVADVVAQCRAKNAAVAAAGAAPGLVWGIADDGTAHVGQMDLASGQIDVLASSAPLSLKEYVAAITGTG